MQFDQLKRRECIALLDGEALWLLISADTISQGGNR